MFEFANDATKLSQYLKICVVKNFCLQYLPGGSNFSGLRVIAKIVQYVNIMSIYRLLRALKDFLREYKNTNYLSGAASSRDFFSVAKFLAHTSNKLKQVKTFVQCSLLEKLPWNANVVGMSQPRGFSLAYVIAHMCYLQRKSVFVRPLPNAEFLSSDWFMRLWKGQPFSFEKIFSNIVVTSHNSYVFLYLFSNANISPVRFVLHLQD